MEKSRPIRALARHLRSNAVGYVALFFALGGVAYAGAKPLLDVNGSVDSANLQAGAVKSIDIAPGAVTEKDLSEELRVPVRKLPPAPANGTYIGFGYREGTETPVTLKAVWRGGEPISFTMTSTDPTCVSPEMTYSAPYYPVNFLISPPPDGYRENFGDLSYLDNNETIASGSATAKSPSDPQCYVGLTIMRLDRTG
jgi:hypothetical protein